MAHSGISPVSRMVNTFSRNTESPSPSEVVAGAGRIGRNKNSAPPERPEHRVSGVAQSARAATRISAPVGSAQRALEDPQSSSAPFLRRSFRPDMRPLPGFFDVTLYFPPVSAERQKADHDCCMHTTVIGVSDETYFGQWAWWNSMLGNCTRSRWMSPGRVMAFRLTGLEFF